MIKIKNLSKFYSLGRQGVVKALDGVSFSLPNKGMIFVVGKSGSGKSTFLNLLGGLDNITDGEIDFGGNCLSKMNEVSLNKYRNSCVGFIFQDYCLIDKMTVYENVELSLSLQNKSDPNLVNSIIEKVDLKGFENRPISKLSGGQKQRVAIARALIKKPKMLLADEPTGNLDSKTSTQILELLKKISEENLVVIVSHNMDDAEKYGDRIIELSDGKVIRDVVNTGERNELIVNDDSIVLPHNAVLNDEELELINKNKKNRVIKQHKSKFTNNKFSDFKSENVLLEDNKLASKALSRISRLFLMKRLINFVITIFLISALVVVLGLCQMFVSYDGKETIRDSFNRIEDYSLTVKKGYFSDDVFKNVSTDKLVRFTDEEIEAFYDMGYEGNIYRLVNATMGGYGSELEFNKSVNLSNNFQNFYARINLGLLLCDEEFLTKVYGVNGELDILAGSLDYKPYGMILTDYMADSYIYYHPNFAGTISEPYKKLIETDNIGNRFAVTAVINTNYKERYSSLLDKYEEYFKTSNKYDKDRLKNELLKDEQYDDFYKELTTYLAITYSINPNYLEDAIEYTNQSRIVGYYNSLDIIDEEGNFVVEDYILQADNYSWYSKNYHDVPSLEDNEIYVNYIIYNEWFGTNLSIGNFSEFEEKKVTFKSYDAGRRYGDEPIYTKEYIIKGINEHTGTHSLLTDEEFKSIREHDVYTFGLYFDTPKNCSKFYTELEDTVFYLGSEEYTAIYQIVNIVDVFKDNFKLVSLILCIAVIVLLISFNISNIRSNKYEIGVLRALGIKTKDMMIITSIHNLLAIIFIIGFVVIGLVGITDIANNILLNSFKSNIDSSAVMILNDIKILTLSNEIILIDSAIIVVLTAISSLVPLILLSTLKPIKIIKAKE